MSDLPFVLYVVTKPGRPEEVWSRYHTAGQARRTARMGFAADLIVSARIHRPSGLLDVPDFNEEVTRP